ncbi:hypothetical protein EV127DRAFT_472735 [Xylaria flabelliformis]|nr:hypothetical protein EV127DRAFT_472735 [Xylaria flabelliformis]
MVLSLVHASCAIMAEEAIRNHARAEMTRAALRLADEAQTRFRADLQAELDKIDRDTEKELEAHRRRQREGNASTQNGNRQVSDDGGITSMLLEANADILIKYNILREDEISNTRSKDVDTSNTVTRQDSHDEPPSGSQELLNIPDSISESVETDSDLESEDIKGWLIEKTVPVRQGIPDLNRSGTPVSISAPNTSFRVSAGFSVQEQSSSKQDPCQKGASDRQSNSKPNEIKQAQNDTKGSSARCSDVLPTRIQDLPKSQVDKSKGVDTDFDPHQGCSLVPQIAATQPAGTSKNPINIDRSLKRETIPTPRSSLVWETTKKVDKDTEKPANQAIRHPLIDSRSLVAEYRNLDLNITKKRRFAKMMKLEVSEKDRSSDPRNLPTRQVSKSELAMTGKGRAVQETSEVPEKKSSLTSRRSFEVPDVPLVHPAASQPATSNKSPIKGEKDKKLSSNPQLFPAGSVSASQPVIGSKRAHSPSPQTPKYPNSPEGSQESPRRRQPRRNSVTPVFTYNDRKKFRNMVGSLDGPEYRVFPRGEE